MPDLNVTVFHLSREIAQLIADHGGRAYFVGGFVRDQLRAKVSRTAHPLETPNLLEEIVDLDVEVHNLLPDTLLAILSRFGTVDKIGKSFGIYTLHGYPIDFALPRKESCVGRGHRDFEVQIDPYLGLAKAAERRDFTANACLQDILTGEIVDPYGGFSDITDAQLRHVSDLHFAEDALRVLRAAQFASRFSWCVHPDTVKLCQKVDLNHLSKERIAGELNKALLKSDRPSIFFSTLREMGQLKPWFSEVADLIGVKQSAEHHAEGDVWTHTMFVLDQAAKLRHQAENPLVFMLAALLHDFGKFTKTTIKEGKIRSLGHEEDSVVLGERFLHRIYGTQARHKLILNHVANHMRPNTLARDRSSLLATNRLFDQSLSPHDLLLLAKADDCGRIKASALLEDILPWQIRDSEETFDRNFYYKEAYLQKCAEDEAFLQERKTAYENLMKLPEVQGRDLMALGIRPSPLWKKILHFSHDLHLRGFAKAEVLLKTLDYAKQESLISLDSWQTARDFLRKGGN